MSDEKKASSGSGLTKLLAGLSMGLIMFFSSLIWKAYEDTSKALKTLDGRLEKLEEDKSKWGTLTELNNRTVAMEIHMGRLQGIMEGFSLAAQSGFVKKAEGPVTLPLIPNVLKPPIKLKDPEDLFKDVEEFKNLQQQKYPNPSQQKVK